jgi:hypothetical protein
MFYLGSIRSKRGWAGIDARRAHRFERHRFGYCGRDLPDGGDIIEVVRFLRDRSTRARVIRVDPDFQPRITAIQID